MAHTGVDCQDCVHLLLDSDGLIVNRIMLEPDAEYDPLPLILAPEGVDGEMGGTYIDGVYTPPPTQPYFSSVGPYSSAAQFQTVILPSAMIGSTPIIYSVLEISGDGSIYSFNADSRSITVDIPNTSAFLMVSYVATNYLGVDSATVQFQRTVEA